MQKLIIIELADTCSANYIITGNTTDFIFPAYKHTQIVTPREYWLNHHPQNYQTVELGTGFNMI
ncbi:MAG: hypothetical protein FWG84_06265 [Bacteroidales bacterium]|nr:hypothetical protein [Bacteroidales bacterium]